LPFRTRYGICWFAILHALIVIMNHVCFLPTIVGVWSQHQDLPGQENQHPCKMEILLDYVLLLLLSIGVRGCDASII